MLFCPAESVTADEVAIAVRFSSGLIHAAMFSDELDRLRIPDQPVYDSERSELGFTVAVDAVGVGTGISAIDRSFTLRKLADPGTNPEDLRRPGHVMPVRCSRPSATTSNVYERALDVITAAGHAPVALICRLVHDNGSVVDSIDAHWYAERHGLAVHS
nr:3,4-dihydroxy-2-butanone-4-phosphate synthase [Rhodococcus sp. 1R11]